MNDHSRPAPSRAAIFGHPVHAMLVPFPVAFLLAAFAADGVAWWSPDPFWVRAATWLVGSGVVTGVSAALFGLIDFLTIRRARAHVIGWVHLTGAGTTLILATVTWLLRVTGSAAGVAPWTLRLSAVMAVTLVVTAWAGGELPYRHLVGVAGHEDHEGVQPD